MQATRVTADTITDDQIRELQKTLHPGEWGYGYCIFALSDSHSQYPMTKASARARCAEILNARKGTP